MKTTKIFITGGHYTPARAVIDQLLKDPKWEVFYLGRKFAMEDDDALALEYSELYRHSGIQYLVLTTGRLQRKFFVNIKQSVKAFLKIFVGLFQSFYYFWKYEPQIVLSFGGYMAVPVVFWGWCFGIPVITHEQTKSIGLANRLISPFATKRLSVDDIGNPLRDEIKKAKPKTTFGNVIFVTGGNQGGHVINVALEKILPKLLKRFKVFHQVGDSQFNDYDRLVKLNKNTFKFLGAEQMANHLANADLVISRSGANIVSELEYLGRPAILIPIPWASANEQLANAKKLESLGQAEILEQKNLTSETLRELIEKMFSQIKKYRRGKNSSDTDASLKIVEIITQYV